MAVHELAHVEAYRGETSAFYTAHCSCGWISDDRPGAEAARERWREHESGELRRPRSQTNMMGPWGKT